MPIEREIPGAIAGPRPRSPAENGWSGLIAVNSIYHVRRATLLLEQCYDGAVEAVTPYRDLGFEGWSESLPHELAGLMVALVRPAC
jgi:hypothetical protein